MSLLNILSALNANVGCCTRKNNACWYDDARKELDDKNNQRIFRNSDEYMDKFQDTVEQHILQAGVRLGAMLNEALDP